MFGASQSKPKTVLVTEFVASPEVEAIDRGFSARLDRKGINYPILERKRRTLGRVNDEIVAAIVATLREAGLDAQPDSEEGLTLNDEAAVVNGRLGAGEEGGPAKNKQIGLMRDVSLVVSNAATQNGYRTLLDIDSNAFVPHNNNLFHRRFSEILSYRFTNSSDVSGSGLSDINCFVGQPLTLGGL